jgi:hypothetical protein
VGPRAGLDAVAKRKYSAPAGTRALEKYKRGTVLLLAEDTVFNFHKIKTNGSVRKTHNFRNAVPSPSHITPATGLETTGLTPQHIQELNQET